MHPISGRPLVGRQSIVAEVEAFVHAAAERTPAKGRALSITGPAGIGKTALADHVATVAAGAGLRVAHAGGAVAEAGVRYAALDQILTPLMHPPRHAELPGGLISHVSVPTGDVLAPDAVAEQTRPVLEEAAARQPVLLIVDDHQWVDAASLDVLDRLFDPRGARPTVQGTALLTARRCSTPPTTAPARRNIHLEPLGATEARHLLRTSFPLLVPHVARRLTAACRGNPLCLVELARALTVDQGSGRAPLPSPLPVTPRLAAVQAERLARQPFRLRTLLLLLAAGGPSAPDAILEMEPSLSVEDLSDAEQAGLIHATPDGRISVVDPPLELTTLAMATAAERQRAHRALAAAETDAVRAAWHQVHTPVEPDGRAVRRLSAAAAELVGRGEGAAAVTVLERAAEAEPRADTRSLLYAQLAYVHTDLTGELERVPAVLRRARAESADRFPLLASGVESRRILAEHGHVLAAAQLISTALRQTVPDEQRPDDLTVALHSHFLTAFQAMRPDTWAEFDSVVGRVSCPEARFWELGADPARATRGDLVDLDAALEAFRAGPDEADLLVALRLAAAMLFVDRVDKLRPLLLRAAAAETEGDGDAARIAAIRLLAADGFATGAWSDSLRRARDAARLARARGFALATAELNLIQAMIGAACGEQGSAIATCDAIERWAGPRGLGALLSSCRLVRALVAAGAGDFEAAYQHCVAISAPASVPARQPFAPWAALDLVEACMHTGRHAQARDHAAALMSTGLASVSPRLAAIVSAAAAIAEPDDQRSIDLFEAALQPVGQRWPFEQARIRLAFGTRLRRGRRPHAARPHLLAARTAFDELGAAPWAARAAGELEAAWSKRLVDGARAGSGARLTAQEGQVAALAATGLSNKEIAVRLLVSSRTVAAHLRSVFAKLDVASRAALRDALGAPGGTAGE